MTAVFGFLHLRGIQTPLGLWTFWSFPWLFVLPKPARTEPSQCSGTSWFTLRGLAERLLCNREELFSVSLREDRSCDISLRIKLWPFGWKEKRIKSAGRRMTQLFESVYAEWRVGPKCLCFAPPFSLLTHIHLGTNTHKSEAQSCNYSFLTFMSFIYFYQHVQIHQTPWQSTLWLFSFPSIKTECPVKQMHHRLPSRDVAVCVAYHLLLLSSSLEVTPSIYKQFFFLTKAKREEDVPTQMSHGEL